MKFLTFIKNLFEDMANGFSYDDKVKRVDDDLAR